MRRFSSQNDAEKIVFVNCFYDCFESKYFLGMLRFYTLLREWGVVGCTEKEFRSLHRKANIEFSENDYKKFTLSLMMFKEIRQSPLFKAAIVEELGAALEKYANLKDLDMNEECNDPVCAIPEPTEIIMQAKEQEIYSAVRFLKRDIPTDLQEKLILFGLN